MACCPAVQRPPLPMKLSMKALSQGRSLRPIHLLSRHLAFPPAAGPRPSAEIKAGDLADGVQQLGLDLVQRFVRRQLQQVHARGGRRQPLRRPLVQHPARHLSAATRIAR